MEQYKQFSDNLIGNEGYFGLYEKLFHHFIYNYTPFDTYYHYIVIILPSLFAISFLGYLVYESRNNYEFFISTPWDKLYYKPEIFVDKTTNSIYKKYEKIGSTKVRKVIYFFLIIYTILSYPIIITITIIKLIFSYRVLIPLIILFLISIITNTINITSKHTDFVQ